MAGDQLDDSNAESLIEDYVAKQTTLSEPPPIKRSTELIESGVLDSLSILKLVIFIEEKFGVKVGPDEVIGKNFGSVEAILKLIKQKKGVL